MLIERKNALVPFNQLYTRIGRWPTQPEYLEEFMTITGHSLIVDHSKGEKIEDKFAELQRNLSGSGDASKVYL